MKDYIKRNVDFVVNSGVTVHVVSILDHVSIRDNKGGEVFLQGDEGSCFISEAKYLWNTEGDISMDEAYMYYAYNYLDLLDHM